MASCKPADTKPAETAPPVASATYTLTEFARMRWMEGDWRGRMADGRAVYESYRYVDDSTMAVSTYSDSTYTKQSDRTTVSFRNGHVVDQGTGVPWSAGRIDSNGVSFFAGDTSGNHLAWQKDTPDSWTAFIFTMHDGHEMRTLIPMAREKRPKKPAK